MFVINYTLINYYKTNYYSYRVIYAHKVMLVMICETSTNKLNACLTLMALSSLFNSKSYICICKFVND